MTDKELYSIVGGATKTITAAFLNSIIRGISTIFEIGQSVGTAIRRAISGKTCSLN